jgi:hypothetical protein
MTAMAGKSIRKESTRLAAQVKKAILHRHFCVLATASPDGIPHAVGVQYDFVGGYLYFITYEDTKKVRNIRGNPNVAVSIPVAKYPLAPPFSVQFQGTAIILAPDDSEILALLKSGKLKKITGHGVLKQPGGCFIQVTPGRKIHAYGLGIPALTLLRDVSHGDRSVTFEELAAVGKGGTHK